MNKQIIDLASLIGGVLALFTTVWQVISWRIKTVHKKKEWVAQVCESVRTISRAMGIGKMDSILNSIRDCVLEKPWLNSNPNHGIISNDEEIDKAYSRIEGLLNDSKVSKEIIDSFRDHFSNILSEYRICRNDLGVVVDLCEAISFDDVKTIIGEDQNHISKDLRDAVDATCRRLNLFDRSAFVLDIIGLRFVDGQIPDYKKQTDDLAVWFQETVLGTGYGTSSGNDDRRYKIHSSSEAMFEKAERCSEAGNYEKAFNWYKKASDYGSREAFFKLGECYELGEGCSQSAEKAITNYEIAAEHGLPIAEYRLGRCYEQGYGCESNLEDAAYYYQRSANAGYPESMYRLGLAYWHGRARVSNRKEGFNLIKDAAQKGCVEAQRSLSALYYLENDFDASMEWAKTAADNGDVEGMGYYGYLLLKKGTDEHECLPWLTKSANCGSIISQFNLGVFYLGEKDLSLYCGGYADECQKTHETTLAYQWFGKAASSGDAASQFILGMFELRKNKNRKAAEAWFKKAIVNGFSLAYFGLALLSQSESHFTEALEYFERSWDAGNPIGSFYLRSYYKQGLGCKADGGRESHYLNKSIGMTCNWFLSDPRNQSTDPMRWYVPPFDRQFFNENSIITSCDIVKNSCYMAFIRKY